MWFLLPIFFGMIGGIIAYIVIRKDDSRKAKNCIYIGIIMMILGIILQHKSSIRNKYNTSRL